MDYNKDTGNYELISIKGDNDGDQATLSATVKADSHKYDAWTEVCFYVATGNKAIDYRVEIWNGGRDSASAGTVFIDNVYVSESSKTSFEADKAQFKAEYNDVLKEHPEYTEEDYTFTSFNYTRTATVLYTDEDGNDATKQRTFEPTEVYSGNSLVKFVSYETIDVEDEIDERTPEEDTSTEDTT